MKDIEKSFVERRGWPRLVLDEIVENAVVRFHGDPVAREPAVEIVNVSEAGAGILLPYHVERGARVTLEIAGKRIPPLGFQAEIRWIAGSPVSTGKYAAGLKFTDLDEQRRLQLRDFMHTLRMHGRRNAGA